jgi:hypothetical protein
LSQLLVFGGLFVLIAVGFQNCGGYQPVDNPLYSEDYTSTCTAASCSSELKDVQLKIANASPISIPRPASDVTPVAGDQYTAVDIAGYCDVAGYADSVFYFELKGPTASSIPKTRTTVKCDSNGRFRLLLHLPGYGASSSYGAFDRTALYTLVIAMMVIDDSGVEHENPTNLHTQEIPLSSGS